MARYRDYSRIQSMMIPIRFRDQIQPGSIEHAIDYLVDNEIDLSGFESRYHNDETGAPAIHPSILLKIVLFGYSRGIISSRGIARACEENVVFMALSSDTRPHFTTIADFVTAMGNEIAGVFTDVLTVCYAEGLIGKKMFAVDGCKISANCSKEWSGTRAELEKKAKRIEESIQRLLGRHCDEDKQPSTHDQRDKEQKAIEHLQKKTEKIRGFLKDHEDRIGAQGKPVKSNITDNDSAKMPSSHGVIQGYNGIATVDAKHQIVVDAQAFGDGNEAQHMEAIVDSVHHTFTALAPEQDVFKSAVLVADSGFNSEAALQTLLDRDIDAYVADQKFRKRDSRFSNQQSYRAKRIDRKRASKVRKYFGANDFVYDESGTLICPAGKPMRSSCPNWRDKKKGYTGHTYRGFREYCSVCEFRSGCIRNETTAVRQVTKIDGKIPDTPKSAFQQMIERFDTPLGRSTYSQRMGTVEPVFGDIRQDLRLDRFTLRGQEKVDAQWKLYCTVHNIGKLARYGQLG